MGFGFSCDVGNVGDSGVRVRVTVVMRCFRIQRLGGWVLWKVRVCQFGRCGWMVELLGTEFPRIEEEVFSFPNDRPNWRV